MDSVSAGLQDWAEANGRDLRPRVNPSRPMLVYLPLSAIPSLLLEPLLISIHQSCTNYSVNAYSIAPYGDSSPCNKKSKAKLIADSHRHNVNKGCQN